jgi:hypothetical protein
MAGAAAKADCGSSSAIIRSKGRMPLLSFVLYTGKTPPFKNQRREIVSF